jgi:hypothetical protein
MAAVTRVVKHAVFSFVDPKGVYRLAVRGDEIEIDGDELARAERFDAVVESAADLPVPLAEEEPLVPLVEGAETSPVGAQDGDGDGDGGDDGEDEEDLDGPEAPPKTANKDAWVDYRFEQQDGRVSKEQLSGLTKEQLQDDDLVAGLQPPA